MKKIWGPLTLAELAQVVGMNVDEVSSYRDVGVLQPARRQVGPGGATAFRNEHVERLRYVRRAMEYGLAIDDIAVLVNPSGLLTCRDVYDLVQRRLGHVEQIDGADTPATAIPEKLLTKCARVGSRHQCGILQTLASANS